MCPNVIHSCCKKSDQLAIYSNYILNREKESLKDHLDFIRDQYFEFLDFTNKIVERADKTLEYLEIKNTSNCKLFYS